MLETGKPPEPYSSILENCRKLSSINRLLKRSYLDKWVANHRNDALISMLSEARVQLLSHYKIDEVGHSGLGILVTDLATVYQAEIYYPETLVFDVGITDFNRYGGDFVFRVTRERDGASVAQAKYGFVFFDYGEKQVTPMPDSFRSKFAV